MRRRKHLKSNAKQSKRECKKNKSRGSKNQYNADKTTHLEKELISRHKPDLYAHGRIAIKDEKQKRAFLYFNRPFSRG
ncbi:hypothetical protein ACFOPX_06670 [Helicobacter baculiformis]|uniref:Uncharacterized protein n=1 Tax=Helicobacter baculiformis TaxID=427351 RepID=A0ABV7ZK97_9HELI|nr:hypothetical protein [Helicobacter baculiformis]